MGLLIPSGLEFLRQNILKRGSLLGLDRSKWAKGLGLKREGEVLFFAGCGYQYMELSGSFISLASKAEGLGIDWEGTWGLWKGLLAFGRPLAFERRSPLRAAVSVLRQEGIEVGYLAEEEPCCGGPLYFSGFQGEFFARGKEVKDVLLRDSRRTLLAMVPSCAYSLRELLGLGGMIETFPEFFLRKRTKKRRAKAPVKVTYHDPCILARYLGVVEQPREILQGIEGVELVEPLSSRQWATCCGGGGGFELVFPEVSKALAKRRAEELLETGAQVVVTACPGCVLKLQEGIRALGAKAKVLDIAEFLWECEPCG